MISPADARKLKRAAERASTATAERDALMADLHAAGASYRDLAELVGLSHVGVMKLLKRRDPR